MGQKKRFVFTESTKKRLGTVPDGVIANDLGCSIQLVQQFRKRHNIPSYAYLRQTLPLEKGGEVEVPVVANSAIPESIRRALGSARPVAGGMVIPYALFAEAISAAGV
jgi:hypothetical protein